MSTDRELLEMAAKAAGAIWSDYPESHIHDEWLVQHQDGLWRPWRPLQDDGDVLRLASDCFIEVKYGMGFVVADGPQGNACELFQYDDKVGRREATRRAIVRAAAEIGRAMP